MKKKDLGLKSVWKKRLKLCTEAGKLWAEGYKLRTEGDKLRTEGEKLWAEAEKLWAETDTLYAEADRLWTETIREIYGNIKIEWKNYNSKKHDYECHLETGKVFKP